MTKAPYTQDEAGQAEWKIEYMRQVANNLFEMARAELKRQVEDPNSPIENDDVDWLVLEATFHDTIQSDLFFDAEERCNDIIRESEKDV